MSRDLYLPRTIKPATSPPQPLEALFQFAPAPPPTCTCTLQSQPSFVFTALPRNKRLLSKPLFDQSARHLATSQNHPAQFQLATERPGQAIRSTFSSLRSPWTGPIDVGPRPPCRPTRRLAMALALASTTPTPTITITTRSDVNHHHPKLKMPPLQPPMAWTLRPSQSSIPTPILPTLLPSPTPNRPLACIRHPIATMSTAVPIQS